MIEPDLQFRLDKLEFLLRFLDLRLTLVVTMLKDLRTPNDTEILREAEDLRRRLAEQSQKLAQAVAEQKGS